MSSDKTKWNKTEKDRKNMDKENNSYESDFSENEVPNWNSFKHFKLKPKTSIVDINSDDEESAVQECSVKKVFLKISQTKGVFLWILRNSQQHLFS